MVFDAQSQFSQCCLYSRDVWEEKKGKTKTNLKRSLLKTIHYRVGEEKKVHCCSLDWKKHTKKTLDLSSTSYWSCFIKLQSVSSLLFYVSISSRCLFENKKMPKLLNRKRLELGIESKQNGKRDRRRLKMGCGCWPNI